MKVEISDEEGKVPITDISIFDKMTDEEAEAVFGDVDILKGGVGSGIKGHKTQQTKGERLSYTAEKKRWMKEKLTPEQKKQLEDIKKIEQDLAEKRESLSGNIDHDIWVDSVKKNRDIRKQVVREVRSKKEGSVKFTFGMADASRMMVINAKDSEKYQQYKEVYKKEHNKANPDNQMKDFVPTDTLATLQEEAYGKDWKKRFEKKEEDPVENILALHKDADIREIDLAKGGPGSGIKGHTTYREEIRKFKKEMEEKSDEEIRKDFNELLDEDLWFKEDIVSWYEGSLRGLDGAVTNFFGMEEDNSRNVSTARNKEMIADFKLDAGRKKIMGKMYVMNQIIMGRKYSSGKISLFRGFYGDGIDSLEKGKTAKLSTYNLSSWTERKEIAIRFAKEEITRKFDPRTLEDVFSNKGAVAEITIPIKKIFIGADIMTKFPTVMAAGQREQIVAGGTHESIIREIYQDR